MIDRSPIDPLESLDDLVAPTPGLQLLVLYGSRARGDHHEGSDWDFAYLGSPDLDPGVLLLTLVRQLGTDHVDLTDLDRSTGLLRFHAARDGRLVFEDTPGLFERYAIDVAIFWCDVEPVVRLASEQVLEALGSE